MADNYINVTVTSKQNKRVTVSTQEPGFEVTATTDTGKFWAQTAENWATSDTIVENKDYSSKYYANKAKVSEENTRVYENAVKETYNSLIAESNGISNEIRTTGNEVIDNINSTKTNIIQDIEFVADGEKKEIEDLIDSGKEELKESIGDVKVLTTLEIGDIGFTQMAIDESKGKRRILNGQLIIQEQYVQFSNIIKNSVVLNPDLACTEAEWQTEVTMNTFGLCGKFVIDDEGGTIRLPKYPNHFIAGLANIAPVVGNGITLGLTNGTNNVGISCSANGTLVSGEGIYNIPVASSGTLGTRPAGIWGVTTDPTKSGIEAQIDEKQIAGQYFIQVATGSETEDNIINEIELNNPFSLLDYKFSEYELNNISWLRSNGQYNSKAIYPAVYDLLLKIYNGTETKAGVSVKLSTEAFTDYDFVLNTAEETFRLPVKVKLASGKAVVGNGMTLGFRTATSYGGLRISGGSGAPVVADGATYGQPFGSSGGNVLGGATSLGVTDDPTKSGLELSDSGLYLYFYVGETVQNANLINAGRIEEKLVDKVDYANTRWAINACMPDYTAGVSVSYTELNAGYEAPYDGVLLCSFGLNGTVSINSIAFTVNMDGNNKIIREIHLNKGDVIKTSNQTSAYSGTNMFFPLKGDSNA